MKNSQDDERDLITLDHLLNEAGPAENPEVSANRSQPLPDDDPAPSTSTEDSSNSDTKDKVDITFDHLVSSHPSHNKKKDEPSLSPAVKVSSDSKELTVDGSDGDEGVQFNEDLFISEDDQVPINDNNTALAGSDISGSDLRNLISSYEATLKNNLSSKGKLEVLIQIGILYWKNLNELDNADKYFRKARSFDALHPTVLDFYRSYSEYKSDIGIIISVLSNSIKHAKDKDEQFNLTKEIAYLAVKYESHFDRAVNYWKVFIRQYPTDQSAMEELKHLYILSNNMAGLISLLKGQLKALPDDAVEEKKTLLWEIVKIYENLSTDDRAVIDAYKSILELEPDNTSVFNQLCAIYQKEERWKNLIDLLLNRSNICHDAQEKRQLLLRSARLLIDNFGNYKAAESPLKQALEMKENDVESIELLVNIYRHQRSWQNLFELLQRSIHYYSDDKKLSVLLELARISSSYLSSNRRADELWYSVLEMDPRNKEALANLEKLSERNENWDLFLDGLEKAIYLEKDNKDKIRLLSKKAAIQEERQKDYEAAIETWKRILAVEPNHAKAFSYLRKLFFDSYDYASLEDLYLQRDDSKGLVEALGVLSTRTDDINIKTKLLQKCAEVYLKILNNPDKSVQLLEKALVIQPNNVSAAELLLPVYLSRNQVKNFIDTLDTLLVHAENIKFDVGIVEDINLLEEQAEKSQKWSALLYLKKLRLLNLDNQSRKWRSLSFSIAVILEDKLRSYPEAISIYRDLVDHSDTREKVVQRLIGLLQVDFLKPQVACIVEPYLDEENHLLSLLQAISIRKKHANDLEQETELQNRLVRIISKALNAQKVDRQKMFDTLLGLLKESPENETILSLARETAEKLGAEQQLSEAIAKITDKRKLNPTHELRLLYVLVDILDKKQKDTRGAIEYYRKIVSHDPDNQEMYYRLENIYSQAKDYMNLLDLYDNHYCRASGKEALETLKKIIPIMDQAGCDLNRQIRYLKDYIKDSPSSRHELDRLVDLCQKSEDYSSLYNILTDQIDNQNNQDLKYQLILADICQKHLDRKDKATAIHSKILQSNPDVPESLNFLEARLKSHGYQENIVNILKEHYHKRREHGSLANIIEIECKDDRLSNEKKIKLLSQLSYLYENHLSEFDKAVERLKEAFTLDSSDHDIRKSLKRLVLHTKNYQPYINALKEQIPKEASNNSELASFMLAELATFLMEIDRKKEAIDVFWKLLDWKASSSKVKEFAIKHLEKNLSLSHRPEDSLRLMQIKLGMTEDLARKKQILHQIADIQEKNQNNREDTVNTLKEILKLDSSDINALRSLSRIYEEDRNFSELLEILKKMAEIETSPKIKRDIFIRISKLANHM